ncbi:MAG: hypothetical protein C4300_07820 [Thermus sp.]
MGLLFRAEGGYTLQKERVEEEVLAILQRPLSRRALEERLGLPSAQVLRLLRRLVAEGKVERTGRGRGVRYRAR